MKSNDRVRALLIGESCNPEWVSVPLVGWSLAQALARVADVHLVTQVRNRAALLRAGWSEGGQFTALDTEAVARWQWRLSSLLRGGAGKGWTTVTALSALTNAHFEGRVWAAFGRRIQAGHFDVVHRITPVSPTVPSPLAGRCRDAGVPFVLGPLNGGVPWPRAFDSARRQEREWLSYLRDAYKLLPGFRPTRRDASAILIASRATWEQMPSAYHAKCLYLPENAIDPARFPRGTTRTPGVPLRMVFVGRLVPYKGADMLIEATAALLRAGRVHLTVVGDGPQRPELEAMIRREKVAEAVALAGWVAHDKVAEYLAAADVFGFPSVREFGGGAVLEAMAAGVPPLVLNYGGPGELVTEKTGWRIPLGSRTEIVARLTAFVQHLATHPEEVRAKSAAGLERAFRQFTWDAKAQQILRVYDWVCGRALEKPQFPLPVPDLSDDPTVPVPSVAVPSLYSSPLLQGVAS